MQIPGITQPNHNQSVIEKASAWLLIATMVTSAVLILPFFDNFMVASKSLVLFVAALVLTTLFLINSYLKNKIEVAVSPIVGALFFFGLSIAAATFLTTKYPVNNILGMGGVYLAAVVIGIIGGSLLSKKNVQLAVAGLIITGVVTAVLTFAQISGFGISWIINSLFSLQLPNNLLFHPIGSPFVAAQLLVVCIAATLTWIVATKKPKLQLLGALLIMAGGLAANVWVILPGKMAQPILMPYTASWSISLDVLRAPSSALIGVGPENYAAAFSIFKPAWINRTNLWNVQFTQGSNMPLTILTSAGLIGLVAWIALLLTTYKRIKAAFHDKEVLAIGAALLTIFGLQFLFSPNAVMITLMAVLLAFLIASTRQKHAHFHAFALSIIDNQFMGERRTLSLKATRYISIVAGGLIILAITAGLVRGFWAANLMFRSVLAMQKNDAVGVYNLQQKATQLNPYSDAYRRQYALTNIQIAAALSNKADATAEEQQQVTQLIQQAIREARAATLINSDDTNNWQVLGQIYRNLIGLASDANQWATSTYAQAIQTASNDPSLRIELGGIFYGLGQYDQALGLFQQAIALKPDLPNAYYNAANALIQLQQYEQAKTAYQQTLALLPSNSDSYIKASQELESVEKLIAEQKKAAEKAGQTTGAQTGQQPTQSGSQVPSILNQTVTQPESTLLQQQQPVDVQPNANLQPAASTAPAASPVPSGSPAAN